RGRRRGVAAGADRGDPPTDHARAPRSVPRARRAGRGGEPPRVRADADRRVARLGREPGQHRAARDGALGGAQERGLVVRDRLGELAAQALGLHEALPVHRSRRRRGRRLLRAGVGRRRAREQEARTNQRVDPAGRRPARRARCAVDRGEVSGAALDRDAEQPRVSPGSDVVPTRGARAQPQHRARAGRLRPRQSEHRLREARRELRRRVLRAALGPDAPRTRDPPRDPRRQARRAVLDRRRAAAAVTAVPRVQPLLAASLLAVGFAASAAAQERASRAAIANGEQGYLRAGCHSCHGTAGHRGAGPRLAPSTLPLSAFIAWVRNGSPNWTFAAGMPAYPAAVVSDAELADVRAYLASLPAPKPLAEIPLLAP